MQAVAGRAVGFTAVRAVRIGGEFGRAFGDLFVGTVAFEALVLGGSLHLGARVAGRAGKRRVRTVDRDGGSGKCEAEGGCEGSSHEA